MKKLSLILVALLSLGFVMAQNKATVKETGDNNTGYVSQTGSNNTAGITQEGDKSLADVSDQSVSSLIGSLLTDTKGVTQVGNNNTGTISQINTVRPDAAGPSAGIGQFGNKNTATIDQDGASAWMQEYAWVKQMGDGNTSMQIQNKAFAHNSHIYQQGIVQDQSQVSVGNNATTEQISGYQLDANIWQIGARNDAKITQGGTVYANDLEAQIKQTGNDNVATQKQFADNNTSITFQKGNFNTSNTIQNGNGASKATPDMINVLQEGDHNIVNLTQGGVGADADIDQIGNYNTLKGIGVDMATSLGGSKIDLDQNGSYNTLGLQQTNGAQATVSQTGSFNSSVVIQN